MMIRYKEILSGTLGMRVRTQGRTNLGQDFKARVLTKVWSNPLDSREIHCISQIRIGQQLLGKQDAILQSTYKVSGDEELLV